MHMQSVSCLSSSFIYLEAVVGATYSFATAALIAFVVSGVFGPLVEWLSIWISLRLIPEVKASWGALHYVHVYVVICASRRGADLCLSYLNWS